MTLDYTQYVAQGFGEAEIDPLLRHSRHFHARGAAEGRLQMPMKQNTIDYERILEVMPEHGYDGYVAIEYEWLDWERMDEVDVLSETILMRDLLRAKIAAQTVQDSDRSS